MLIVSLPGLVLLVLPGLGRAFGAVFLRETGGSAPVALLLRRLASARRASAPPRPQPRPPHPVGRSGSGSDGRTRSSPSRTARLVFRGLLPHLTWGSGRRLGVDHDFWSVAPEPAVLEPGTARLLVSGRAARRARHPLPQRAARRLYAEEVQGEVRREWDALNEGFAWLTCLLSVDVQGRAFDHRGGPRAARRPTPGHGGGIRPPRRSTC